MQRQLDSSKHCWTGGPKVVLFDDAERSKVGQLDSLPDSVHSASQASKAEAQHAFGLHVQQRCSAAWRAYRPWTADGAAQGIAGWLSAVDAYLGWG